MTEETPMPALSDLAPDPEIVELFARATARFSRDPSRFAISQAIGPELRRRREEAGYDRAQFARKTVVPVLRLRLLELGLLPDDEVYLEEIDALCEALGVDADQLLAPFLAPVLRPTAPVLPPPAAVAVGRSPLLRGAGVLDLRVRAGEALRTLRGRIAAMLAADPTPQLQPLPIPLFRSSPATDFSRTADTEQQSEAATSRVGVPMGLHAEPGSPTMTLTVALGSEGAGLRVVAGRYAEGGIVDQVADVTLDVEGRGTLVLPTAIGEVMVILAEEA